MGPFSVLPQLYIHPDSWSEILMGCEQTRQITMNNYTTTLKCTFLEIKKAYFWMKIMILFFFCQKDNAIICEKDHLMGRAENVEQFLYPTLVGYWSIVPF